MKELTKELMDLKQQEGFANFMATESTKVLISQIPEGQSQEGLKALLRGAYDAGHGNGVATVMIGLLESMFKDRPRS
jgi:hypothetical protein